MSVIVLLLEIKIWQLLFFCHSIVIKLLFLFVQSLSFNSCKPLGSWVMDLLLRVRFFQNWTAGLVSAVERSFKTTSSSGSPEQSKDEKSVDAVHLAHPKRYWLSGFFFPQGLCKIISISDDQ